MLQRGPSISISISGGPCSKAYSRARWANRNSGNLFLIGNSVWSALSVVAGIWTVNGSSSVVVNWKHWVFVAPMLNVLLYCRSFACMEDSSAGNRWNISSAWSLERDWGIPEFQVGEPETGRWKYPLGTFKIRQCSPSKYERILVATLGLEIFPPCYSLENLSTTCNWMGSHSRKRCSPRQSQT